MGYRINIPLYKSSPKYLRLSLSATDCDMLWRARSLATRSVASRAAFTASVFGITRRDLANSAIAICSRDDSVVAKFSETPISEYNL